MKKYIILVLAFVFLAGCLPVSQQEVNYRVGYSGLQLNYITFPEYNVYENENFTVQLEIWNKGAYDISNAVVVLGFPIAFIDQKASTAGNLQQLNLPQLKGASKGYPSGEANVQDFIFHAKPIFAAEQQIFDITATACYGYNAEAEMLACIGPRTTCNFKALNQGLNLTQGQGAPLAVTEVEETIIESGQKMITPRFRIVVENKGDGNVFRNPGVNVRNMCSSGGVGDDLNRFDFKLQLSDKYIYDSKNPSSQWFVCPQRFKLEDDKVELICSLKEPVPAATTFNTLFKVSLDYGYASSITKQLTVVKPVK